MRKSLFFYALGAAFLFLPGLQVSAQNVVVQAESGSLGSDFRTAEESGVQYITCQTNDAGQSPGSDARVSTYSVTYPAGGVYELYARIRVGPAQFEDDSFHYSNGFGSKAPGNASDWITANGLSPVGFTNANDVVTGGGTAPHNIWKWIKLSAFNGGEAPITFTVPENSLTQTFSIGAREDGLDIDKFVFAPIGTSQTVAALNGDTPNPPAERPIAYGSPKYLGNIYSSAQLPDFTRYWNQVAPENAGKWGSVESTRNVMNWSQLDAAYRLAKDNGFPFRMHVLIWGNQQPSWIENLPAAEQLAEIREWFSLVAARYPDIDVLEVVNEPLHDPPSQAGSGGGNYINALGGSGSTGWDWIITSFRLAREFFPNAKLMLNEYNIVSSSTNTNRYVQIINLLKAENLIDAIGVQAHAFSTRGSSASITANLNTLAATNIPIYATEMDIDGPSDEVQLQDYQRIFPLFWEHPGVYGVTLWGFRPGLWRNDTGAFLIRPDGTERPALIWLRNYVASRVTSIASLTEEASVLVYPNPVTRGRLTIAGAAKNSTVQVFSTTGALIKEHHITQPDMTELELDLGAGLYILRYSNGNKMFSKRIVVQ